MPTYPHPRPALTVDLVVIAGPPEARRVLLVRRGLEPFRGRWALPGGFVDENEPLEHAARRELEEETGLSVEGPFVQVGTFGDPGRDPRGWTVSVAFGTALDGPPVLVHGADDADEAAWLPLDEPGPLAFDHELVLEAARERLGV
jgi:8-oxo-dGTP diphosphatase